MKPYLSRAPFSLIDMNRRNNAGIERVLGIRLTAIGPDFICGEMPVDERTRQPFGILHGGASIVLAETLGSWASWLLVSDEPGARVAGIEVSGSHVWSARSGIVSGICRPVRLGRSLHFWRIDVHDAEGNLCCAAKLTVKVDSGQT
ncbi:MAG: hotdog fold thioesterase [Xanthomonadales bacterium]|nr:hotdog fold thioesterase [Xanthomonadales bacterium]